jgi:AbrB family looped-hinge helix DNA binding protein
MSHQGEQTMSLVKVRQKGQVTLPQDVRDALRLEEGNLLEASVENHAIVLKPKVVVDRSIDEAVAEGRRDYREGRFSGPFDAVEEFEQASKKNPL